VVAVLRRQSNAGVQQIAVIERRQASAMPAVPKLSR
jgi:hypothetical protein